MTTWKAPYGLSLRLRSEARIRFPSAPETRHKGCQGGASFPGVGQEGYAGPCSREMGQWDDRDPPFRFLQPKDPRVPRVVLNWR